MSDQNQKYLCLQRSQPGECSMPSLDQMKEMQARFKAWMARFQGNIVDLGGRLGGGKVVTSRGATDSQPARAGEVVGGFMILTAGSLDEALTVARECPGVVSPGSSVEVREIHTG